jgi:hypothetical protein
MKRALGIVSAWLALGFLCLPASTTQGGCPETCSPDAHVDLQGSLPLGASLAFHWANVSSGTGIWLQAGEQPPRCANCTPCEGTLQYHLHTGGHILRGCYSPDGGSTWATAPNDTPLNTPADTVCGGQGQDFRIEISSDLGAPCGQGGMLTGKARLGCGYCF